MHDSVLAHPSWHSERVVALLPHEPGRQVEPGETTIVRVALAKVPEHTETFQVFVPELCWLPRTSFTVRMGPDGSPCAAAAESTPKSRSIRALARAWARSWAAR